MYSDRSNKANFLGANSRETALPKSAKSLRVQGQKLSIVTL